METFLAAHGLAGMFLAGFLAATLLPLGSEWLLVLLIAAGHDPLTTVAVATAGNYLGACTTWAVGVWGGGWLARRFPPIDPARRARAEATFRRWGSWSLLFSWLPVIGDPLCLVAGALRVGFPRFSVLVAAGKLARYAAVAWLTLRGKDLFS